MIPTTSDRVNKLQRALKSLFIQSFPSWEAIVVVTDGGTIGLNDSLLLHPNLNIISTGYKSERVIGRNLGMRKATGEWICWLDSDDEYMSCYLEKLEFAMALQQGDCYNFSSIVFWKDGKSTIRQVFKPQELGSDTFIGREFESGRISTGSFVFRRSLLNEVGYLPESTIPYGTPDSFSANCNNPNYPPSKEGIWPPLGNPWGDDFQMFYQITRRYDSVPLDLALYVQHIR
ncbi:glycosyltransferase family 2 protein [bacterium]|nr:glycosyltransferase family 2 protein [bacterium]